jgi:hypothetical protein
MSSDSRNSMRVALDNEAFFNWEIANGSRALLVLHEV